MNLIENKIFVKKKINETLWKAIFDCKNKIQRKKKNGKRNCKYEWNAMFNIVRERERERGKVVDVIAKCLTNMQLSR